jgi:hypothetical protein
MPRGFRSVVSVLLRELGDFSLHPQGPPSAGSAGSRLEPPYQLASDAQVCSGSSHKLPQCFVRSLLLGTRCSSSSICSLPKATSHTLLAASRTSLGPESYLCIFLVKRLRKVNDFLSHR